MSTEILRPSERLLTVERRRTIGSRIVDSALAGVFFVYAAVKFGPQEAVNAFLDRDNQIGLTEGSLIQSPLAYADPETGLFTYESGPSAAWVTIDHNRHKYLPAHQETYRNGMLTKGTLFAFLLDEIIDNPPHKLTPTSLLQPWSLNHLLAFDAGVRMETLVEHGFVEATNYGEAYTQLEMPEMVETLERRSLAYDPVYQVTPKGHTLIMVTKTGGDKVEKPETKEVFEWVTPGRFAH